jgi:hypothetical protein
VILGKTLEECAYFGKCHVYLNMSELKKYLRNKDVKLRFKKIFGSAKEYNALVRRIETYESW